jgi:hypothetical protein
MKSFILSTLMGVGLISVTQSTVIRRDGPVRPDRKISAPGATRATARYGPFKLPSSTATNRIGMSGFNMDDVPDVKMPCQGCTYTYIRADMVYKDGISANIANGAYMHHITLTSGGKPGMQGLRGLEGLRQSLQGSNPKSIDLANLGFNPFFLIGNERLPLTFPNAGVYLAKNASITLSVQLQNFEKEPKDVYIDLDYDYLPGQPEGYVDIIPVPQDALGIGGMLGGIKQSGVWERTSSPYKARQDSRVLMIYGHVHDGGIHTEIMINGKVVCDSLAYYQDMKIPANQTTTAADVGAHSHAKRDNGAISHIVAFGECVEVGNIKKGDAITTKVYYNFDKRPSTPMPNGKLDGLMGISMTYLGIPMKKE